MEGLKMEQLQTGRNETIAKHYRTAYQQKTKDIPTFPIGSKYVVNREIGRGAYGIVYVGYVAGNENDRVAIKQIRNIVDKSSAEAEMKSISSILLSIKEANILKEVAENGCQPHIVCYRDFFMDPETEYFYLVTDYIRGLTLDNSVHDIFNRYQNEPIAYDVCYELMIQLLEALAWIHERHIIHSDVKPTNIMVNVAGNTYTAFLIDFGFACVEKMKMKSCPLNGTILYSAPEAFLKGYITPKSDIWALGISFYQVLMGQPYPNVTSVAKARQAITNPEQTPKFDTGYLKIDRLGQAMLTFNEEDRPTAKQILELVEKN